MPTQGDRRPGEGQRLRPDAHHNGGRPPLPGDGPPAPPRHAAPTGHATQGGSAGPPHPHTHAHSTWIVDPDSPPGGRAVGGGGAPDPRHPSQRRKAPPPGTPFRHPHREQRRPTRAHAVGLVPGPHARANRTRDTRVTEPLAARPRGREAGEGTAPDTRRPSQQWQATPLGDGPPPAPRHAAPTGQASQGDSAGPPQRHTRAHSTWIAGPGSPQEEGSRTRESARPRNAPRNGVTHARRTARGSI